jgi:3-isopropylmalate/(R)-2-methylmalate dehydratase large subunit
VIVLDHFVPNKDIPSAEQVKMIREFAMEQGVILFDVGRGGIEHILLPQQGLVLPGEVIIGGDSHTCTYGALGAFATGMGSTDIACALALGETWMKVPPTIKVIYHGRPGEWLRGKDLILYTIGQIGVDGALYTAMEFTGEAIQFLSMDERFAMANMSVEAGAKVGLFPVDDKILDYIKPRAQKPFQIYEGDEDAEYAKIIEYDISKLEPQVACPHLPSNVKPVSQIAGIDIDQAFIGSCTDGRLEDLRIASQILKGKRVHPQVRLIVIPGSQQDYLQALKEGILSIFIEAGAVVSTPTCGPCLGGHMGVLGAGERCIATINRNFKGRMGSPQSEVYLANSAVVIASAILGRIASPEEVK